MKKLGALEEAVKRREREIEENYSEILTRLEKSLRSESKKILHTLERDIKKEVSLVRRQRLGLSLVIGLILGVAITLGSLYLMVESIPLVTHGKDFTGYAFKWTIPK